MADNSGTHLVKSARRVLEVLEYFDRETPAATVTEIARALSYPQSSTSVLLRCLRQLGYLYYNRYHRTYRLTARAALLGCWAEDGNLRGGRIVRLMDDVAARVDQTVVLSVNNCDYAVHHVHVVRGSSPDAAVLRPGASQSVLHSPQGELVLASYPDPQIRLALHRLNAEEPDPARCVNIGEKLSEMRIMRDRGWTIDIPDAAGDRGCVAVFLPHRKGGDRLALSIVAEACIIEERSREFLDVLLSERDRAFASAPRKPAGFPALALAPSGLSAFAPDYDGLPGREANEGKARPPLAMNARG